MGMMTLQIDGLHCGSCVGRAEKALAGVAGVRSAVVNLASGQARIDCDNGAPDLAQLTAALDRAGYPAQVATADLAIDGMSCASCLVRIERALTETPGVTGAHVNLSAASARVQYLQGVTTAGALAQVVTAQGYPTHSESRSDSGADRQAAAAAALRRQVWIAGLLTLPVFLVEMGGHLYPPVHHWIAQGIGLQPSWVIQFLLITAVLAWPGRMFFTRGLPALFRGHPDMNALVAIGTLAAWGFSTVATFAPGLLPAATRAVYFEAAGVIVTLILLGRMLEARAKGRTGQAIRALIGLRPDTAIVIRNGAEVTLPLDEVAVGDELVLRPGARVATDGAVTEGASHVDESMITGEPVPVAKGPGDALTGGTINGAGALRYRASQVGADTVLARIVEMVKSVQGAKLPVQDVVNRVTGIFVPVVLGLAALTVLGWLVFGPDPALTFALVAGVSVLIVACPCAMGLAVPTSIMVGTGRAAAMGVLFRKGAALQSLRAADMIAFDKTGTLTAGRPELTTLALAKGMAETDTLPRIAAIAARSEHPVAQAILRAASDRGLAVPAATSVTAIAGFGARGQVAGQDVLVGADRLMTREGVDIAPLESVATELAQAGGTPVYAAIDGQLAAVIGVTDPVKPGAARAIAALKAQGRQVAMITGDNAATARHIAGQLGIDRVSAEVLPAGKVDAVRALGGKVAFVGDGINDAPALAAAHVGIAIGTGTDVAIASADVVLMSGDPAGVVNAIDLSTRVMRNIRQNLFWAFAYNAALIPVAAGLLYPAFGVLLSPMLAAGAMALSSVFVLSNALRLQWVRPRLDV